MFTTTGVKLKGSWSATTTARLTELHGLDTEQGPPVVPPAVTYSSVGDVALAGGGLAATNPKPSSDAPAKAVAVRAVPPRRLANVVIG